jgi:hypothetical protein
MWNSVSSLCRIVVLLPLGRSLFICRLACLFYEILLLATRFFPVDLFFGFSVEQPALRARSDCFGFRIISRILHPHGIVYIGRHEGRRSDAPSAQ